MTILALCLPFCVGGFGVGSGSSEGHRRPDARKSDPRGLPAQRHPAAQTAAGSTDHREAPQSRSFHYRSHQLASRCTSKPKAGQSKTKNRTEGIWKCSEHRTSVNKAKWRKTLQISKFSASFSSLTCGCLSFVVLPASFSSVR